MSVVGEVVEGWGEFFWGKSEEEIKESNEVTPEKHGCSGASKDLLERQMWEHRMVEHQLHHKFDHKLSQQEEWNRLDQLGSRLGLLDPDVDGVDIEVMTIETFQTLIHYLQENSSLSLSSFNLQKVIGNLLHVDFPSVGIPPKDGDDVTLRTKGADAHVTTEILFGNYKIVVNSAIQNPISIYRLDENGETFVAKIDHKIQKVRNCTKGAICGAILTLYVLDALIKEGKKEAPITQELIDSVQEKAKASYRGFTTAYRLQVIRDFLTYCKMQEVNDPQRCCETLYYIIEKLAIFNRPIPQEEAIAIVKEAKEIWDTFYAIEEVKEQYPFFPYVFHGCALSFLKQVNALEDKELIQQLKQGYGHESSGARQALYAALFSNRSLEPFYAEYEKFFDINTEDELKHTLIHLAAAFRSDKGIEFLINKGASLTVVDKYDETPLHVACLSSDYTIWADPINHLHRFFIPRYEQTEKALRLLIENGPEAIGMQDNWGEYPFENLRSKETATVLAQIAKALPVTEAIVPGLIPLAFLSDDMEWMESLFKAHPQHILDTILADKDKRFDIFKKAAIQNQQGLIDLLVDHIEWPPVDHFEEEPQVIFSLIKEGAAPETIAKILKAFPEVKTHLNAECKSLTQLVQQKYQEGNTGWLALLPNQAAAAA